MEACFPKCFPVCAHMTYLLQKHFPLPRNKKLFPETVLFSQQRFPRLRAEETMFTRPSTNAWAAFPKLCGKPLFSVKSFLVYLARKHQGQQRLFSAEYPSSAGLNRLRYSDLVAVKTKDFFGETSPRTYVTRGLINSYCFRRDKYVV